MGNKMVLDFKLEIAKLEGVITDIQNNIQKEIDRKREVNTQKVALIRQGGKRKEVIELNKELLDINANILFYQEEIEIMKEHIADLKHEKVVELLDYRQERYNQMLQERTEMEKQLYDLKKEYLDKVKKVCGQPVLELRKELWELNDVIREHGDGTRFKQPRQLGGMDLQEFSAPRLTDGVSPFVMKHEIEEAIRG